MALPEQNTDYRGPGYVSSAVGKAATVGAVTGAVAAGAGAIAETFNKLPVEGLNPERNAMLRGFDRVVDGAKNLFKKAPEGLAKEFSAGYRANRIAAGIVAASAVIGGFVGLRNAARGKADHQLAQGQAADAQYEAQALRRENAALTAQTQEMAGEMEAIATAIQQRASAHKEHGHSHGHEAHKSHVEKHAKDHDEHGSHAQRVEAEKDAAAEASMAI